MTTVTLTQPTNSFTVMYYSYQNNSWNTSGTNNVGMQYQLWADFGVAGIPKDAVIASAKVQPYLSGGANSVLTTPVAKLFDQGTGSFPTTINDAITRALKSGSVKSFNPYPLANTYLDWDITSQFQSLVQRSDWTTSSRVMMKFECTDAGSNYFQVWHPYSAYGGQPSKFVVDYSVQTSMVSREVPRGQERGVARGIAL